MEPPSRTTRFLSDGRYGVWLAPLQRSLQVLTIGLSGLPPEQVESQPLKEWVTVRVPSRIRNHVDRGLLQATELAS